MFVLWEWTQKHWQQSQQSSFQRLESCDSAEEPFALIQRYNS